MVRSLPGSALLLLASFSLLVPAVCEARPKRVKLPMLEVPDDAEPPSRRIPFVDRSALIGKPIELSNADDRRVLAREQLLWSRLNGSLCTGCGETRRIRKVAYVDPIAVLNAKPALLVAAVAPVQAIKRGRAARIQLAHRRHHRSKLYSYYNRLRYAVLKWRRHHRVRTRAVHRNWTPDA
ncbi:MULTISPECIES: hypothetical protein [Methylobacterium]|jgi:hypothetical protein|uniref:Secreted protein n=1 Tax=Methylobacterium longum TaxID=767694 RepID=A0ABT8AR56_9HYPH|nr:MULTISPECIES: hypothetical protein [Methylobacterium]MCJ2101135.1 hypothetical protein [Methylobacterium sp. E-046]MDN3571753.1 hypothetical protein [Methylobacterium longum]GJE11583.1 hypothetical protein FOHLNKBM_2626 [Methylobacterium longum]